MKRRAMRGADQQPVLDQKLTRSPIQTPPRVGTFVVKRRDDPIFAGKDQFEATGARLDMSRNRPSFGDGRGGT